MEACNLILCLLPLGLSNFRVTRDQPQPGSLLDKREEPGNVRTALCMKLDKFNFYCHPLINNLIWNDVFYSVGIVYCFSKKDSFDVATGLRSREVSANCYHAGLTPESRTKVHHAWTKGSLKVILTKIILIDIFYQEHPNILNKYN